MFIIFSTWLKAVSNIKTTGQRRDIIDEVVAIIDWMRGVKRE